MTAYEKLTKCYECVKSKIDFEPKVALVLGSGLGDYANSIDVKYTLSYKDIEGFPTSTVEGHKGQFVFGYVGKVPVVIMQGRVHYYEGYAMEDVVLPARLMRMLGFLLYISLISGNLVPSSSMFLPIRGLGTKLEIWSVISMKSPALKPAFTPPDAFVRKSTFAPN